MSGVSCVKSSARFSSASRWDSLRSVGTVIFIVTRRSPFDSPSETPAPLTLNVLPVCVPAGSRSFFNPSE